MSTYDPLTLSQLIRHILKSLRTWILSAIFVGIILAIFAISPHEWGDNLGAWYLFIKERALATAIIIIIFLFFLFLVKIAKEYNILHSKVRESYSLLNSTRSSFEFPSLFDTREKMINILHEFSLTPDMKVVKIIAATGGSVLPLLSNYLETDQPVGKVVFNILLMNPESPNILKAASHWSAEVKHNLSTSLPSLCERLKTKNKAVSFAYKTYDFFPCVQGLFFGEQYLFISWMEWIKTGDKYELRGAERPFSYFEKGDKDADYFFSLFNSWYEYAWNDSES